MTPLAVLAPLAVKAVVALMDKVMGGKTGSTKKSTASSIIDILFRSAEKTELGTSLPSASELPALIELAWAELNKAGLLKGRDTVIPLPALPTSPASGGNLMVEIPLELVPFLRGFVTAQEAALERLQSRLATF